MGKGKKIAVLAVQGAFAEQIERVSTLGAECIALRQKADLMQDFDGLILLAEEIGNDEHVWLGTLPVRVQRNAYGRQLGSFHVNGEVQGIGMVPMTFIRAPYVEAASQDVEILARVDEKIVAVRYGNQLGMAFHPELDTDNRIHEMFLTMCEKGWQT